MNFEPNTSTNFDLSNNFMDEESKSSYTASEVDLPEFDFNKVDLGFDGFHNAGGLKKAVRDAGKSIKSEGKKTGKKIEKKLPPKVQKFVDKNEGGVLAHKVNQYNPATLAVRGAVISMLQSNLLGIATSFGIMRDAKSKQWNDILQKWWIIGGDKDKLNSNVDRGKNKKPFLKDVVEKFKKNKSGFDGEYSNAGGEKAGAVVGATAGLLSTAAGVLAVLPDPTSATKAAAGWVGVGSGFLGVVSPMMKSFAKDNGATTEQLAQIPDAPTEASFPPPMTDADIQRAAEEDDKIMGIPKTEFWIGIGLLATIIIGGILLNKKKHKIV